MKLAQWWVVGRSVMRPYLWCGAALAVAACEGVVGEPVAPPACADAGSHPVVEADAGGRSDDGGEGLPMEPGPVDAGPVDAGPADAGLADAGLADAGVPAVPDAGPPAPFDAGFPSDGGFTVSPTHPRIYLNAANLTRLRGVLAANGSAATRFDQIVSLAVGGTNVYAFEAWNAALIGRLRNDPSYCQWAVARIDATVTAEEALIAGGGRPEVAGDSYLEVGERIGDLAIVYDWCFDQTTPQQRTRWLAFANQAVWNVWHHPQATWGGRSYPWSGWSVNNPANNYYYSFLRATMLLGLASAGEDPSALTWLTKFRDEKIRGELVPMFQRELEGGGSREGTGYGTAMKELFRLYDVWRASTGENLADLTTHAQRSMPWLIHATVPTLDRLAPIGDHSRDSTAELFDYHRDYLQVLSALYPADPWARLTKTYLQSSSVPQMTQGFMRFSDFIYELPSVTPKPLADIHPTYRGIGTGQVFARSGWSTDATWLGFTAGPYTESHAHHDQGQLLLFKRQWLGYDGNIDSHSGIVQGEEAHSLVRLSRGTSVVRMQEGAGPAQLLALREGTDFVHLAGDIAPAYPTSAGVARNQREVVFLKPNLVVVFDRVGGSPNLAAVTKRWQFNSPLTPVIGTGSTLFSGTTSTLRLFVVEPSAAVPTVSTLSSVDSELSAGTQWSISTSGAGTEYFLVVLSLDGAATTVTASSIAGERGASIALAAGGTVRVRFHETTVGGSIEWSQGASVTRTEVLDATVAAPPLLDVP